MAPIDFLRALEGGGLPFLGSAGTKVPYITNTKKAQYQGPWAQGMAEDQSENEPTTRKKMSSADYDKAVGDLVGLKSSVWSDIDSRGATPEFGFGGGGGRSGMDLGLRSSYVSGPGFNPLEVRGQWDRNMQKWPHVPYGAFPPGVSLDPNVWYRDQTDRYGIDKQAQAAKDRLAFDYQNAKQQLMLRSILGLGDMGLGAGNLGLGFMSPVSAWHLANANRPTAAQASEAKGYLRG